MKERPQHVCDQDMSRHLDTRKTMMSLPLHFLKVINIKKEVVTKASHKHRQNFNDINVMKEIHGVQTYAERRSIDYWLIDKKTPERHKTGKDSVYEIKVPGQKESGKTHRRRFHVES